MKKIVLLSIALITAGFLSVPAQNTEQLNRPNVRFGYSEFEKSKLSMPSKVKPGQDWWEPDTVYVFNNNYTGDEIRRVVRYIFKYQYHSQGLLVERIEQGKINDSWLNSYLFIYIYLRF